MVLALLKQHPHTLDLVQAVLSDRGEPPLAAYPASEVPGVVDRILAAVLHFELADEHIEDSTLETFEVHEGVRELVLRAG